MTTEQAIHDLHLNPVAIPDELDLSKRTPLTLVQHPRQPIRTRVGKDVVKIRGDGFWPDGHGAAKFLQPDLAPVLAHGSREEFEVAQDFEPFVQVEFDVLLDRTAQEASTPASSPSMGYWTAYGASGTEKEQVDMWVYLGDYGEISIEMEIQCFNRNIRAQTPILPSMTKGEGSQTSVTLFGHEDDGIQDSGNRRRRQHGTPNHTVGTGQIVCQDGGGMRIGRDAGYIEDATGPLERFAKGHGAPAEPATLPSPSHRVESGARSPETPDPDGETFVACLHAVGQCGDQQSLEFVIRARRHERGDQGSSRRSRDDLGQDIVVQQGLDHAQMVVGEGGASGQAKRGSAEIRVQLPEELILGFVAAGHVGDQLNARRHLVDVFLDQVLGAEIRLAVDSRVLDTGKVALDAHLEQGAKLFNRGRCVARRRFILFGRRRRRAKSPFDLPSRPFQLCGDLVHHQIVVIGVLVPPFPILIPQVSIQFLGAFQPVGVVRLGGQFPAQPLAGSSPGHEMFVQINVQPSEQVNRPQTNDPDQNTEQQGPLEDRVQHPFPRLIGTSCFIVVAAAVADLPDALPDGPPVIDGD